MKITLVGASGRMGQAISACAIKTPGMKIAWRIDDATSDFTNEGFIGDCDLVIDFSFHLITPRIAELCAQHNKPLVTGTTGHTPEENKLITDQATKIPMVKATNFSTGVNTLFWLTRKAAEILGPDFDLEVIEMHHRLKKDAPSGTAMNLAEILGDVRNLQLKDALRHGRHLAMMPHPERCFRLWQWPWMPSSWHSLDASPWLRMFQNARTWCMEHRK